MRRICWVSALLVIWATALSAAGGEVMYRPAGNCYGCQHYGTMGAPACGWQFCGWLPGCCECPPSACDNAWATYCQEKARRMAFWYSVGTGVRLHGSMPCWGGYPVVQPTPAGEQPLVPEEEPGNDESQQAIPSGDVMPLPPVPQPPEGRQTTWRITRPWRR